MGAPGSGSGSRSTGTGQNYTPTNYSSLRFGQPVYNVTGTASTSSRGTATTGTRSTLGGSTGLGGALGGLLGGSGIGGAGSTQSFRGVTSAGTIRAPQYVTEPVFERITPRPAVSTMRPDLQEVLSSSSLFRSGDRVQVMTEGEKVVLRGSVTTERERRIAEAMIRMTPGVREVANEITIMGKP
ncbi:MAG: BON domain-containing protein [Planctomycetia bacterium]|nr:BON domain-containing protein [Planctomycetia bacterium]